MPQAELKFYVNVINDDMMLPFAVLPNHRFYFVAVSEDMKVLKFIPVHYHGRKYIIFA